MSKRPVDKVTAYCSGELGNTLDQLLNHIKTTAGGGHSFSVVVDPDSDDEQSFGVDGDGADHITKVERELDVEESMHPIMSRIGKLLSEANEQPPQAKIIDINSQAERMNALRDCRGPNVGWEDYVAGRDYQPPMYYNSSVPLGPEDTIGNPHSSKYGGVRPWSEEEIIRTIMTRTNERSSEGLLWIIARKPDVRGSWMSNRGSFDEEEMEESIQLGAMAALRALTKDEGRLGTRFTAYIGVAIPEGMKAGVPAGFRDEYRDVRGLLGRLQALGNRARRAIAAGQDIEPFVQQLHDELHEVDPKPSANNHSIITIGNNRREVSLGFLAPKVVTIGKRLHDAMVAADENQMIEAVKYLDAQYEQIAEEEQTYYSMGPKTFSNTVSKPKAQKGKDGQQEPTKPLQVGTLTVKSKKTGDEVERSDFKKNDNAYSYLHSPEIRELLSRAIRLIRSGEGSGKAWSAQLAMKAISSIQSAMSEPAKRHQFEVRGSDKTGFEVFDAETGDVVGKHDWEKEAQQHVAALTRDPRLATIRAAIDRANGPDYGEFGPEIKEVCGKLYYAVKSNDEGAIQELLEELQDLSAVAKEDAQTSEGVGAESLTQNAYRVLIRTFGISDYPERGTVDDPEIDENGELSDWAKAGYPPVAGPGSVMSDKDVAKDLGVSGARISQWRKAAMAVFVPLLTKLQEQLQESGEIDLEGVAILLELRVAISRAVISEVLARPALI